LVYGLTSVGKDELVGFVLVDTRTKETIFYKQEVQQNMRLKVQRRSKKKEYQALPIPYNINNIPTYVMTLKDKKWVSENVCRYF
jgi:hypothetical protein